MKDSLKIILKISNVLVKSYCVKQKKQTECVPGSENGRTMMKCTCAECGITKVKFVKNTNSSESRDWFVPVGNSILSYEGSYLRELKKQKKNQIKKWETNGALTSWGLIRSRVAQIRYERSCKYW